MTQILIPTDMSEGSRTAALFALDAFDNEQSRFILMHAIAEVPRPTLIPEFIGHVKEQAREEMELFIAGIRAEYPGKTLDLQGQMEFGSVYAAIERYVSDHPVDMVVMGTRGEGGALKWGSNTEVMARNASGPVIVVPPEWKSGPIDKILYADDREDVMEQKTLLPLVQLAKRFEAGIEFVHVSDEVVAREPATGVASHAVIFQGIKCTTASTVGTNVTESLARLADSGKYGMVAVLHRRLGWMDGLFHRSVAKRVALNTTVPLLVMHE